ncbi:hypothetical protein EDD36DRAFT_230855 [Exophiala viscosa]|uniref:Uncharacterized protein n=1 Tax=Exophiala viscosa TaxID=2486360 RepID=A0AAN6DYE4_9EURO|nr:hypothetical protein EDD36DRAFT_230855 [Exophiala viscosa]
MGLTSKFFAQMAGMVDTALDDQASIVKFHRRCPLPPCMYTTHLSDRRILLLTLRSYMPWNYRLCWKCVKYTKISDSKWFFTTRIRLDGLDGLNLDSFKNIRSDNKIWAHADCVMSGTHLAMWAIMTPGACGGFCKFLGTTTPLVGGHLYHHC